MESLLAHIARKERHRLRVMQVDVLLAGTDARAAAELVAKAGPCANGGRGLHPERLQAEALRIGLADRADSLIRGSSGLRVLG